MSLFSSVLFLLFREEFLFSEICNTIQSFYNRRMYAGICLLSSAYSVLHYAVSFSSLNNLCKLRILVDFVTTFFAFKEYHYNATEDNGKYSDIPSFLYFVLPHTPPAAARRGLPHHERDHLLLFLSS